LPVDGLLPVDGPLPVYGLRGGVLLSSRMSRDVSRAPCPRSYVGRH
jgi:hypothetical protein